MSGTFSLADLQWWEKSLATEMEKMQSQLEMFFWSR